MKKHLIWGAAALLAVLLASGCKKEESSTLPGLTGLTINTVTPYVPQGATVSFTADVSQLVASDSSEPGVIGLYWQVDSGAKDTLTRDISKSNPAYTLSNVDAGSHTVICYAFADNYYNGSSTATFNAIDPDTAITGITTLAVETIGTQQYPVFRNGGLIWMGSNLYGEGGLSYSDAQVLDKVFGNYFSWEEASAACPEGWRLPSAAEFDALGADAGKLMVDALFLDEEMWTYWPAVKITNELYFNAIPVGYMDKSSQLYRDKGLGDYAAWWTADRQDELAAYRYIFEENPLVQKGQGSMKSLALSVRCVKSDE